MHNALARIQGTFGYFTTCAFTLASIIAVLSVVPYPATSSPAASISVRNVQVVKGRPHYYSTKREEYAQIKFDLNADLSPLFTWNTKQVFVYVTANYPSTTGGDQSESVIWDMIVPSTSTPYSFQNLKQKYFPDKKRNTKKSTSKAIAKPGVIVLKNQKPRYQITDPSGKLSELQNATLQVSWNIQPWVGALVWDKGYLGSRTGQWKAGKVGRSETFEFPALKGTNTNNVKDDAGPKTPKAGSAAPIVDL
jgi:signal peptidase complex subunit 3